MSSLFYDDYDAPRGETVSDELIGGDPCPSCGAELDWDEDPESGDLTLLHPEPQCGWLPSGYPSTRRGWSFGRDPAAPEPR